MLWVVDAVLRENPAQLSELLDQGAWKDRNLEIAQDKGVYIDIDSDGDADWFFGFLSSNSTLSGLARVPLKGLDHRASDFIWDEAEIIHFDARSEAADPLSVDSKLLLNPQRNGKIGVKLPLQNDEWINIKNPTENVREAFWGEAPPPAGGPVRVKVDEQFLRTMNNAVRFVKQHTDVTFGHPVHNPTHVIGYSLAMAESTGEIIFYVFSADSSGQFNFLSSEMARIQMGSDRETTVRAIAELFNAIEIAKVDSNGAPPRISAVAGNTNNYGYFEPIVIEGLP